MNTYYADCEVSFTDNSEDLPWNGSEGYSFIIQAKNKKEGKEEAQRLAKEELINQLGEMDNVFVKIHQFYRTTDDARAD
jgi:predicted unusual protein kinase regulating ubiquinone biosynthesis (AarF/ABC1/UbiB family)